MAPRTPGEIAIRVAGLGIYGPAGNFRQVRALVVDQLVSSCGDVDGIALRFAGDASGWVVSVDDLRSVISAYGIERSALYGAPAESRSMIEAVDLGRVVLEVAGELLRAMLAPLNAASRAELVKVVAHDARAFAARLQDCEAGAIPEGLPLEYVMVDALTEDQRDQLFALMLIAPDAVALHLARMITESP